MLITASLTHGAMILELEGRLDGEGASELEKQLQAACDQAPRGVVLEMSLVDYVNSSGLRVIARFLKLSQETGCQLRVIGLTANVQRALQIVGLDSFIPTYETLEAALAHA